MDARCSYAANQPLFHDINADSTHRTSSRQGLEEGFDTTSEEQLANARREAEYVARRNGVKQPLLQIWKVGT